MSYEANTPLSPDQVPTEAQDHLTFKSSSLYLYVKQIWRMR